MIKRVTIYGDSFAEPQWNDTGENTHPTWYGRLKDRWSATVNYGKAGSGPMYSFKQFYQDLPKLNYEDLIVFVISWPDRICWDSEAADQMRAPARSKEEAMAKKFTTDTFRDETVYGNWKYESLLYTASRIQKCKIFIWHTCMEESYIKTSLNDDNFYVHNESLGEACSNEYVEEQRRADKKESEGWTEKDRRERREAFDLGHRVNHLTEMNHEVMYKQIVGFVDGREIPKFLKNVYKGTYNKEMHGNLDLFHDEFVYD